MSQRRGIKQHAGRVIALFGIVIVILISFPPETQARQSCDITVAAGDVAGLITAIEDANTNADTTTICLTNSTYTLTTGPYISPVGVNGLPIITAPLTILGGGATITRVSTGEFRFFNANPGIALTLDHLTLTLGKTFSGGAVYSAGPLTITNSQITGNSSKYDCGGVAVFYNSLTVRDSTFGGNTSGSVNDPWGGAAICVMEGNLILENSVIGGSNPNKSYGAATIYLAGSYDGSIAYQYTLRNTQITNNVNYTYGGALRIFQNSTGTTTLDHVEISGNGDGGLGLLEAGTVNLLNNTLISGNQSDKGGGIYNWKSDVRLYDTTRITGNHATSGGGVYNTSDAILTLVGAVQIDHNTATGGGGIYNDVTSTVVIEPGAQIDHNTATQYGGGILNFGGLAINHAILSGNTAVSGGGVYSNSLRTVAVHTTCLTGNSPTGVDAYRSFPTYPPADASHNWWGAANGPSGAGPGSGDGVSTNVRFAPYLTTPGPGCGGSSQATLTPAPTMTFATPWLATVTGSPTPVTPSRTPTPNLICSEYQFEFQSFEPNGVVHFKVSNGGSTSVNVTAFHLNWAHTPSAGPLASVSVGGVNAFDPAGVLIWNGNGATSPTDASSGGGTPTWLAEAPIPAGQARDVWFNFNGTTGTLTDLGYNPIDLAGSTLTLGTLCVTEVGALVPTATPTITFTPSWTPPASHTPLPSPTSSPSMTHTPTRTPTRTPTYTPSPTRTVDPAYLSSSGCVPLSDPAGTILCTQ